MSEEMAVPFLGSIGLELLIADAGDGGRAFVKEFPDVSGAETIQKIAGLLPSWSRSKASNDLEEPAGMQGGAFGME